MTRIYEAILQGDQFDWGEVRPPEVESNQRVKVTIVVHEPDSLYSHGPAMAETFNRLAAMDAFSYIDDPVAWQREIRQDRPLPGRE